MVRLDQATAIKHGRKDITGTKFRGLDLGAGGGGGVSAENYFLSEDPIADYSSLSVVDPTPGEYRSVGCSLNVLSDIEIVSLRIFCTKDEEGSILTLWDVNPSSSSDVTLIEEQPLDTVADTWAEVPLDSPYTALAGESISIVAHILSNFYRLSTSTDNIDKVSLEYWYGLDGYDGATRDTSHPSSSTKLSYYLGIVGLGYNIL